MTALDRGRDALLAKDYPSIQAIASTERAEGRLPHLRLPGAEQDEGAGS